MTEQQRQCAAVAVRTGRQCKNEAEPGKQYCKIPAHQRQVAERSGEPAPDKMSAEIPGDPPPASDPPRAGDVDGGAPADMVAELPQVSASSSSIAAEIAAALTAERSSSGDAELDAFDREVRKQLGARAADVLEDDPAEVDRQAAAAAEDVAKALHTPFEGRFHPSRVAWWLRVIVNPRLQRDGKDLLTEEEITEGSAIVSEWLEWAFGEWAVDSRMGRTLLWCGTVFGVRYWEELLTLATTVWRWGQRRSRGLVPAPRPQRPVDPPADGDVAGDELEDAEVGAWAGPGWPQ